MKKKTIKTLSLKKQTIADLQAVTGGKEQIVRNTLLDPAVSAGDKCLISQRPCPNVTDACNPTYAGFSCQCTIA